jgi:crotonobetainyl-CoA:carnitine CoA-transferase CaiB-like acyl-CoA transferase
MDTRCRARYQHFRVSRRPTRLNPSRVLVIKGAGDVFGTGRDLKASASLDQKTVTFTRDMFRAAGEMPLDNALDMGRQLNQLIGAKGRFAKAGRSLRKARSPGSRPPDPRGGHNDERHTQREGNSMVRDSLKGIRVLDFTQIGAGPNCTMTLGDLGAEVIKVEPPSGELGRKLGPPWYGEESPVHIAFNRGKKSICLDLKDAGDRACALELCLSADVVVESYRPGVMKRFGLGHEELTKAKPSLIYCSVTGFGQTGPMAEEAGVDGIIQAASGLMSLIGVEGEAPCKVQAPIVDVTTGYIAAVGILARLAARREADFVGGHLDVNLLSCAVALQQSAVTSYFGEGKVPAKIGSAAPYSAPNEAFETSDGWIMVAAYIGDRWARLCRVLERPELIDDPRLVDSSTRVQNRQAMREALAPAFRTRTTGEWMTLCKAEDILCAKVSDYDDLVENEQIKHLRMITEVESTAGDTSYSLPAFPINSREGSLKGYDAPRAIGADTEVVLKNLEADRRRA